jgi:hypothetical protein
VSQIRSWWGEHGVDYVIGFWMAQLGLWVVMMGVVEVWPHAFISSLLYTIQISHWALVESAGAAAGAALAVRQGRHTHRAIRDVHRHVARSSARERLDVAVIERDIARLAGLQPGPEGRELATDICSRLRA